MTHTATDTQSDALAAATCEPCEGGVKPLTEPEAREHLKSLPQWSLSDDAKVIARKIETKDFVAALAILNRVAEIAESEQHHPDLHLTGYRHLTIELTTHAIDGLSRNDFIVAAKIDRLSDV